MNVKDQDLGTLLARAPQLCILGLSPDPSKPSHSVPLFMREKGWEIHGVYPKIHAVHDFTISTTLAEVPSAKRKFLTVFRASAKIPDLVTEILDLGGVEVLWLQLGIAHSEAEAQAERAGLKVISNRCLLIEQQRWNCHPQKGKS